MSDTCVICSFPLVGTRIGAGDGTGQKFAHPSCYWQREAEQLRKERDEALARANARLMNPNVERRLRDDFAMAALTGLLARGPHGGAETAARTAYEYADAMLARRVVVKP